MKTEMKNNTLLVVLITAFVHIASHSVYADDEPTGIDDDTSIVTDTLEGDPVEQYVPPPPDGDNDPFSGWPADEPTSSGGAANSGQTSSNEGSHPSSGGTSTSDGDSHAGASTDSSSGGSTSASNGQSGASPGSGGQPGTSSSNGDSANTSNGQSGTSPNSSGQPGTSSSNGDSANASNGQSGASPGSGGQPGTSSSNGDSTNASNGQSGASSGSSGQPGTSPPNGDNANASNGQSGTSTSEGKPDNAGAPADTANNENKPAGDENTTANESGKPTTSAEDEPATAAENTQESPDDAKLAEIPYADQWAEGRVGAAVIIDPRLDKPVKFTVKASANSYDILDNGDGTLTYIPKSGFVGVDTFTYSYIDEAGQEVTQIARVTINENDSSLPETAGCEIYATHSEDNTDSQLVTIDPVGYSAEPLGPFYKTFDIEGIAINPVNQLLYAISGSDAPKSLSGRLYTINARTGDLRMLGNTNMSGITDLAFRPDGTLWGWSKKKGIVQIDPETAQSAVVFTPEPSVLIETKDPKPVNGSSMTSTPAEGNTNPSSATPVQPATTDETTMTGAVLFVEDSGLRGKRYVMPNIKGLAWNTDGTLLYATERVYTGKTSHLWVYDGQSFQSTCENLPPRIDSLEALPDGLLMFAIHEKYGNQMYVYDPKRCEVVLNHSFVTQYPNLDAVARSLECQPLPELQSWKFKFDGEKNTSMCFDEAHWITLKGIAMLDPPESQAYLETSWQIIKPRKGVICPPSDSLVPPPADYCAKYQPAARQTVTGHSEFSITGWWPGFPKEASEEDEVEVRYTAQLLDLNGQPVPGSSKVVKTLKANLTLCMPPSDVSEESASSEETDTPVAADEATTEAAPAENAVTCQGITPQSPADPKALKDYFAQLAEKGMPYADKVLTVSDFAIDDKGVLSVMIEGQSHYGMLGLMQESVEKSESVVLTATDDVNNDGVSDFTVTYPNGQVQSLIYFGTQAPACQAEETAVTEETSDTAAPESSDAASTATQDTEEATTTDANKPQGAENSEETDKGDGKADTSTAADDNGKNEDKADKPQDSGSSDTGQSEETDKGNGKADTSTVSDDNGKNEDKADKPQDSGSSDTGQSENVGENSQPAPAQPEPAAAPTPAPAEESSQPAEPAPVVETPVLPPVEATPAPESVPEAGGN